MSKINEFLNKWGLAILMVLMFLTFFNTCGMKGKVERLDKKLKTLETTINYNDSINNKRHRIEMEIYNLQTERSTLHNMNEIVLKNIRPAERISQLNEGIDSLSKTLQK